LTVAASPDTARVRYYYEWHFIGESTDKANGFLYNWSVELTPGQDQLVTAVAYDDQGLISEPSDAGDKSISVVAATNKPVLMAAVASDTDYDITFGDLVPGLIYAVQQKGYPSAGSWAKAVEIIATGSSTNIGLSAPTPTGGVFRIVYSR
jgi:hypothetical protein